MFRNDEVGAEDFQQKFVRLKKRLDERADVHLDSEYHRQLKAYITRLYEKVCQNDAFDDEVLADIREPEMSNLNRLQKLKNTTNYKKDKHKAKRANEDWG